MARTAIDEQLARPLDPTAARAHDRERWGLTPDAIAAAEHKADIWGKLTYGENPA